MRTLKDLLNGLRETGVLASEIKVPRKMFGDLMQRGEEIAEEEAEEEDWAVLQPLRLSLARGLSLGGIHSL